MNRRIFRVVIVMFLMGVAVRFMFYQKYQKPDNGRDAQVSGSSGYSHGESGSADFRVYRSEISGDRGGVSGSDGEMLVLDFNNHGEVRTDGGDSNNVDSNNEGVYVLKIRSDGTLVMDGRTRLAIERLNSMYTPDELREKLKQIQDELPAEAHNAVVGLLDSYDRYSREIKQLANNGSNPDTIEEALRNMQDLHDQRVMYFGEDGAEALFGKEEEAGREMLELVYSERRNGR